MCGNAFALKGMSPVNHPEFRQIELFLKANHDKDAFITRLFYYINLKGKTNAQVYNTAGMTPDCFSKIISRKTKSPKKENVIALAFALELNLDEAKDLLSCAGYSFTHVREDIVFEFCFEKGPYSIDEVNDALVKCRFNPIGGRK